MKLQMILMATLLIVSGTASADFFLEHSGGFNRAEFDEKCVITSNLRQLKHNGVLK